jgi:hypothetical protein
MESTHRLVNLEPGTIAQLRDAVEQGRSMHEIKGEPYSSSSASSLGFFGFSSSSAATTTSTAPSTSTSCTAANSSTCATTAAAAAAAAAAPTSPVKSELAGAAVELQLEREFRSRNLALVHSLLSNPLQQLISTVAPTPTASLRQHLATLRPSSSNSSQHVLFGLLYMYDSHLPSYREDGLQWEATKKMCVKLVVYNEEQNTYKLKNSKTDQGSGMLRRC